MTIPPDPRPPVDLIARLAHYWHLLTACETRRQALEAEVTALRQLVAEQESTFNSFAEHHAATEKMADAWKARAAAAEAERDTLKKALDAYAKLSGPSSVQLNERGESL